MKYKLRITDEENKKEIKVSEDEIMEVKYKIGLAEDTNLANSRSTVEMEIIGKIISNLENTGNNQEIQSVNDDLYEKNKKNINWNDGIICYIIKCICNWSWRNGLGKTSIKYR